MIKARIEIPMHSRYKYELDKDSNLITLDRPLNQIIPTNYGFIENTLSEDNDPLDVFIITKYPLISGSQCKVNLIAAFVCTDNEIPDHKLIASLENENTLQSWSNEIDQIRKYLETYKTNFKILSFVSKTEAFELLSNAQEAHQINYNK